jgi:hypothetical protein
MPITSCIRHTTRFIALSDFRTGPKVVTWYLWPTAPRQSHERYTVPQFHNKYGGRGALFPERCIPSRAVRKVDPTLMVPGRQPMICKMDCPAKRTAVPDRAALEC